MGNDKDFELDSELAKSIEKLVDEETSVAKAFVDRNIIEENIGNTSDESDFGKTQIIPEIKKDIEGDLNNSSLIDRFNDSSVNKTSKINQDSQTKQTNQVKQTNQTKQRSLNNNLQEKEIEESNDNRQLKQENQGETLKKKKLDKKTKLIVVGIIAFVILTIAIMVCIAMINNKNKKNTYEYNYSKGMEYYSDSDYTDAVDYLKKADELTSEKKNIELKFKIYDCYIAINQEDEAVGVLNDILECEKYNEKAIKYLASYFVRTSDSDKLNELIQRYKDTDGAKYLSQYLVDCPTSSEVSGTYHDELDVTLTTSDGNTIYYSLDGSIPTQNSTLYRDSIHLEKGNTTIKAVSINAIGTKSDVIELNFVIEFSIPDSPQITPASGSYSAGQLIEITNINQGDTAYYTIDGSSPTAASTQYVEPFEMPEGNTIISVLIVSEHNIESAITKRNYNVALSKTYTFDESISILKSRMIQTGDLLSDGNTVAAGGSAKFVYYAKKTIDGIEMYLTYFDIVVNSKANRQNYFYGIAVKSGQCYKVTESSGAYSAVEY